MVCVVMQQQSSVFISQGKYFYGSGCRLIIVFSGENGMQMFSVIISLVISIIGSVVVFWMKGIFWVCSMCIIRVCESRFSMNQLDWNSDCIFGLLVVNMNYISVQVVMLKIDEVGLIQIMKWLMFFEFYLCGLVRNFLFILFYGSDSWEMLYIRFCSSRWIVSIGRKGMKVLVISIENMLLKLELVVMFRYFMMLLKVLWFLIMFFFRIIRFFFRRMMLVDFLVMLVLLFIEMLILVFCSVGVLLMLLLRKLMVCLLFCRVLSICDFCSGVSLVNIVCFLVRCCRVVLFIRLML